MATLTEDRTAINKIGAKTTSDDILSSEQVALENTIEARINEVIADLQAINSEITTYTHTQSVANAVWTIVHNLGRNPLTMNLREADGTPIVGFRYQYDNLNQMTITHGYALAGTGDFQ